MPKDIELRFGKLAGDALDHAIAWMPEITAAALADRLADAGVDADASDLLEAAATAGLVERIPVRRCPVPHCRRVLSAEEIAQGQCPYCYTDLRELGEPPHADVIYKTQQSPSRDIAWIVVVHGMNTRGEWQEELSWRIANKLKYHAPVLIYKYGWIRVGVLFRWRHYALARELGLRIRKAIRHAQNNQITQKPDVVLHSFGNQLFRLLLEMEEFKDLNFGRIITTGSIIRPDFRWGEVIDAQRVEAVLNHCGGQDVPVRITQFCIPGTGPGGRHGFCDRRVGNVLSPTYAHGTVFEEAVLAENLEENGLWYRFLTLTDARLLDISAFNVAPWQPVPGWLCQTTNAIIIGLIATLSVMLAAIGAVGARDVWSRLF